MRGYRFTGPGNLYGVTYFELAALNYGGSLLSLRTDGVTPAELEALDRFAEGIAA